MRNCMSWDRESSPFVCLIYKFQSINIGIVLCAHYFMYSFVYVLLYVCESSYIHICIYSQIWFHLKSLASPLLFQIASFCPNTVGISMINDGAYI